MFLGFKIKNKLFSLSKSPLLFLCDIIFIVHVMLSVSRSQDAMIQSDALWTIFNFIRHLCNNNYR